MDLILGDSLEALMDYRGKTPRKLGVDFTTDGVPIVSAQLVAQGVLNLAEARYVSRETHDAWMSTRTQRGDVLLTSEAPLGRVAQVPSDEPLVLGQRLFGLRGRAGILDNDFLYYALQTQRVQADLVGRSTGSTVFGIRQSALRHVVIPAPAFSEQRAIAEVLGALDDKIAANTKVVGTTKALGEALFEKALKNADSIRLQLKDVATNVPGRYLAKTEYATEGPFYVYGSNSVMGRHDEALCSGAFAVLAKIGSYCGNLRWSQRPAWVNNNASAIVPSKEMNPWILRQVLKRVDMAPHRAGTGQPYIRMESLFAAPVEMPSAVACEGLAPLLQSLAEIEANADDENRNLAATRDALLPLLMSGKIRVNDAEQMVGEVV